MSTEDLHEAPEVGVIGGSGLQRLADQEGLRDVIVDTPWGPPSAPYRVGRVLGRAVAFLARHGDGHRLLPSEVNYRANIWGFRQLGVRRLISASAVGSLREELAPRHFVVVDQFIDRTHGRRQSFFGDGLVAHVSFADPTCRALSLLATVAARDTGATVHDGGTYVCIEGPQFSTRAESRLHRSWGADVVGMTNVTEARLAREAGLCYSCLAMVTDYDCWREGDEEVSVDALLTVLRDNAALAGRVLGLLISRLAAADDCRCRRAIETAVITERRAIPPATLARLAPILEPDRPGGPEATSG